MDVGQRTSTLDFLGRGLFWVKYENTQLTKCAKTAEPNYVFITEIIVIILMCVKHNIAG